MIRRFAFALLAAALMIPFAGSARAQDSVGSSVYKKALKSVVWVVNFNQAKGSGGTGSGSLIDYNQGLIVTNYHVVKESPTVTIMFPMYDPQGNMVADKEKYWELFRKNGGYRCKVLFAEKKRDLAIIQMLDHRKYPKGTTAIEIATTPPSPGDNLHSVGSPGKSAGLFAYTNGYCKLVTNKKWLVGDPNDYFEVECRIIESTSPTNHGDSGGPLMNDKGQQVGVTEGGVPAEVANNISVFVEISEVLAILKEHKMTLGKYRGPGTNTGEDPEETGHKMVSDSNGNLVPGKSGTTAPDAVKPKELKENSASPADEKAATLKLATAKSLIDSGKIDSAKTYLAKILKDYPNTAAAKEAKELAKEIEK